MSADRDHFTRLIFSGLGDIEEWRLGDPALAAAKNYPRAYPAELIDDRGMLFVDIALDARDGSLVCHEVNGPNAVGSDALTGDSRLRAENEAQHALVRAREMGLLSSDGTIAEPIATIHAHQHWKYFRTGGEFYPRAARFADLLGEMLPGTTIACRAASDPLGDERIAAVVGDVPSIALNLEVDPKTEQFRYRGRPVVFIGNPNLLPELVRIGKLKREGRMIEGANLKVLHAWRLAGLFHDKAMQQKLMENTGIRPLRHFAAMSREAAARLTREMLSHGPIVLKPAETSGGAGVSVIVPEASDAEIDAVIETLIAECRTKYGDNAEANVFPIGGFEFVRSTGYPMADGDHLWDLRIALLFEPGKAQAFPVSFRFAPRAFDPATFHRDRDQWVSNVSGRRETLLKSGMDDEVFAKVGLDDALIEKAMQACVKWTMKAWDQSVRGGGAGGTVFEDEHEAYDRPFYMAEKFVA
jgi:hypothetical protein